MSNEVLVRATYTLVDYLKNLYEGWDGVSQFKNTPMRLTRMYEEFCWSPEKIRTELDKQFKVFENGYDEMLITGPIAVWVLCPHHLLPVKLDCWIGYVPDSKVLGLSKFTRISTIMGKRPIMQEQYTTELVDMLVEKLKPKGVGVYIKGVHGCMTSRGIKQRSSVTTSSLKGCLLEDPATRSEFYSIVMEG